MVRAEVNERILFALLIMESARAAKLAAQMHFHIVIRAHRNVRILNLLTGNSINKRWHMYTSVPRE